MSLFDRPHYQQNTIYVDLLMLEATATQQKMLMMQNWIYWFNSEGATEKWIFRKNIVLGFPQYSTYPLTPHTIYTSTLAA